MTMDADKKQTLTVSSIRNINVANIMQSILRDKTKTRSELAKENHISVMTVKHIVDDLIATGGSVEAAIKLVEELGGEVVKVVFLMELAGLKGRERLKGYDVASVICYDGK